MQARLWPIADRRLLAPALLTMVFVTGCEKKAPDTNDPLADIAASYREILREEPAVAPDEESPDTAGRLRTLGRRAAAENSSGSNLLAAGIHAKAGVYELAAAERMNSRANLAMDTIGGLIDNTELLAQTATSRESMNVDSSMAFLEQSRDRAQSMLEETQSELGSIRSPIEVNTAELTARRDRASELEAEAAVLARKGLDAGPLDGHDSINSSIDLRREAQEQRIAAARNEIELATLEPRRRLLEHQVDGQQSLVDAAKQSQRASTEVQETAMNWANSVKQEIAVRKTDILEFIQLLADEQQNLIIPAYETAIADFTASGQAARRVNRSGSNAEKITAAFAVASSELGVGRVQWALAGNLESQAALLARLSSTGDLIGREATWKASLEETIKTRDEAVAAAEQSFQSALTSIGAIRGPNIDVRQLKASIETAIQVMQGADLISMEDARRSDSTSARKSSRPRRTASSGGAGGNMTPGFDSPQAVVKMMETPPSDWKDFVHITKSLQARTSAARSLTTLLDKLTDAVNPFVDACMSKFGSLGSSDPFQEVTGVLPSNIQLKDVTADSALLTSPDQEQDMKLVKVDGRWFIDLDGTIGDDPQMQQMIPMLRMMATPIINQIGQASEEVANQINAGKFSNADAAVTAFSDKMSKIVESLLGGMMGGPGGGGGGGGFGGFGPGK